MVFERQDPSALSRLTHRVRDWSFPTGLGSPGYFLWNALPAMGLALWGVLGVGRRPMTAGLCGVIVAPLMLLALTVPAVQFKYLTDLYVLGFLVVPIALLEHALARRPHRAPGNPLAANGRGSGR